MLVDGDGVSVADPAHASVPGPGRAPSGPARVRELIARLPLTAAIERPNIVHMGEAWLPRDAGRVPSIPFAVLMAGGADPADQRILGVELVLGGIGHMADAISDQHAVALLDARGTPLAGAGQALLQPERLKPLLGTDQETDFKIDIGSGEGSGEVRGTIIGIPETPGWSVVVAEPVEVVLASTTEIRKLMVPQIVFAIVIAAVLAFGTASSLSRPVEQLRDAALRVAEGEVGVHAEVDRGDEIGELARAFDHMSDRLRANRAEIEAQQGEIEAFARELQQRVDERTRELRDAQEELVRSGQLAAVAELGAGLAHELNNPLAAVLGLAQLLRHQHPDNAVLSDLETQANRCRDVVATMMRVSELEVDPTDAPVVELSDVFDQVRGLVEGPFRQRGVALAIADAADPADRTLKVRVDPVHGSRVLAQILNALRAGLAPGATVTITPRQQAEVVVIDLVPDRPVADRPDRRDDWLASGHGLWVARQLLARLGGRLVQSAPARSADHPTTTDSLPQPPDPAPADPDPVPSAGVGGRAAGGMSDHAPFRDHHPRSRRRDRDVDGAVAVCTGRGRPRPALPRRSARGGPPRAGGPAAGARRRAGPQRRGSGRDGGGRAGGAVAGAGDQGADRADLVAAGGGGGRGGGVARARERRAAGDRAADSGAVRLTNRGRVVLATNGDFAVGVERTDPEDGAFGVMQINATRGSVSLSGMDATQLQEGEQAVVIDRHAEVGTVPEELLLAVDWPAEARTRAAATTVSGVTLPGALVKLSGTFGERTVKANSEGRFVAELPLEEGDNPIEVSATDILGKAASIEGMLQTRDTRGPSFGAGVDYNRP